MSGSLLQISEFRRTKYFDGIQQEDNFRPVQPLNGRIIKATFYQNSGALYQPTITLMTSMVAIVKSLISY